VTREKRFTFLEVATGWLAELMIPRRDMRPSIVRVSEIVGIAVQPAAIPPLQSAT